MSPTKRILVALDLSELDPLLIQFASYIARSAGAERVYFVNILRSFHIPSEILREFPDIIKNAVEERRGKMKELVKQNFENLEGIKAQYLVKDGQPAKKILQMVKDSDIDLVLAGKKKSLEGTGVLVQRLARRSDCSLLIVPEGSSPKIEKLLVPSDFSENSKLALEAAINIAERNSPDIQLIVQNVYSVPAGYHYTGKTYEEFSEVMKKHAKRDYKKFVKDIDTRNVKVKDVYSLDKNENKMSDIYAKAKEIKADGIVIGAKGRTAATALFLGSIAERAIQMNEKFPLLVVRPKGQNAGFMDFILDI
ncbi:universal stress protein [Nafulsella turpanensis]|uniref:universal stress protein n=1 Tax=Nafulsella turpanensis TaxID=1265690 RepID=UPI00034825F3|nr:universal stress protein [Nafulsella turpanensis]